MSHGHMMHRSQEFHYLTFGCKQVLEFVERHSDGVDPELQMSADNAARAEFLLKTGWLEKKYIGCRGDKLRYIRTTKQ